MRAFATASVMVLLVGAGCAPQPSVGVGATASASAGVERQCFSSQNVSGFRLVDDDRAVDLTVGANQVYRAELFGTCPEIRSAIGVGVRTRTGGSSFICDDVDLELVVPSDLSGQGPRVCQVRSLRRLSAAEVEASRSR